MIELAPGRFYRNEPGQPWLESREAFELIAGAAIAHQGPNKLTLAANANTESLIQLTTPSGLTLRSHPVGIFLFSPKSGKSLKLGQVKDSVGEFLPPNQLIYRDCFDGVRADLRVTYTLNAVESDVILREDVIDRVVLEPDFANDSSVRLENWTEFVQPPKPRIETTIVHLHISAIRSAVSS